MLIHQKNPYQKTPQAKPQQAFGKLTLPNGHVADTAFEKTVLVNLKAHLDWYEYFRPNCLRCKYNPDQSISLEKDQKIRLIDRYGDNGILLEKDEERSINSAKFVMLRWQIRRKLKKRLAIDPLYREIGIA